jgi:hypothetical protein
VYENEGHLEWVTEGKDDENQTPIVVAVIITCLTDSCILNLSLEIMASYHLEEWMMQLVLIWSTIIFKHLKYFV